MANYAIVKDGAIIELQDYVPVNWNNITNFIVYENDEAQLKQFGWYKIVKRVPQFNSYTQRLSAPRHSIENDVVYEDYDVTQVISSNQEHYNEVQNNVLNQVRKARDKLLANSDWTQAVDIQQSKSPEWIDAWKTYRQNLRDLPQKLIQEPKNHIQQVYFPKPPEIK